MRRISKYLNLNYMEKLAYIFVLVLTSISAFGASDIVLSNKIKPALRDRITRDLSVLDDLQFRAQVDLKTLNIMEMTELNSTTVTDWLNERVKYIVDEKTKTKNMLVVEQENVDYPNADDQLFSSVTATAKDTDTNSLISMTNIGAETYITGKAKHQLYRMDIKQKKPLKTFHLRVDSPRAGILQIGAVLFSPQLSINRMDPDAFANSIFRLAFMFHEARHSDGQGSSLGFAHSVCPRGHDYENELACDESLNGAYSVGAAMAKQMMLGCGENCSERDKEMLKIFIIDNYNRVQTKTHLNTDAKFWNTSPEKL